MKYINEKLNGLHLTTIINRPQDFALTDFRGTKIKGLNLEGLKSILLSCEIESIRDESDPDFGGTYEVGSLDAETIVEKLDALYASI